MWGAVKEILYISDINIFSQEAEREDSWAVSTCAQWDHMPRKRQNKKRHNQVPAGYLLVVINMLLSFIRICISSNRFRFSSINFNIFYLHISIKNASKNVFPFSNICFICQSSIWWSALMFVSIWHRQTWFMTSQQIQSVRIEDKVLTWQTCSSMN